LGKRKEPIMRWVKKWQLFQSNNPVAAYLVLHSLRIIPPVKEANEKSGPGTACTIPIPM